MAQFLYVYHGGTMPETPAAGEAMMKQWTDWMGKLGAKLVTPGNPVGKSWTVDGKGAHSGGGANPTSGYSIVEAASLAEAVEMAKGCPQAADPTGSIEVAEIMPM